MTITGIKKALEREEEIECFVLTSTFKIYPGTMIDGTLKLDETAQTLEFLDEGGKTEYLVDVNDIDVVVFNKGNKLNPIFPV